MYDIYYAHHQWKYCTDAELYELDLIGRYFPNATIFNPSRDLKTPKEYFESQDSREEAIMEECLETVRNSDILIFSSLNGTTGEGVYREVEEAKKAGKLVLYIFQDTLHAGFHIYKRTDGGQTNRLYAFVDLDLY